MPDGGTMDGSRCDSYCGIYCGACDILAACRRGEPGAFSAYLKERVPPAGDWRCKGCKSDEVFGNCARCPIRACARERGLESCAACPEFPCAAYSRPDAERLLAELPHLKLNAGNLAAIAERGVEAWLRGQEELWRCPECGAPDSWYAETCPVCGASLAGRKPYGATSPS
ncbi:MAG TPA: DUF3795 domain-containing protein [Spirochaetia bacterium]|nr:DUF3795 domain-containing protein [Spirochaetales bacterium]HRY72404.1 DUF3795 domain-containing protein [Spirochaetia bacterium]